MKKPSAAEEDFHSEGLLTGFYRDEDNAQGQCGIVRLSHHQASGVILNDGGMAARYHFVIRTILSGTQNLEIPGLLRFACLFPLGKLPRILSIFI